MPQNELRLDQPTLVEAQRLCRLMCGGGSAPPYQWHQNPGYAPREGFALTLYVANR
jgi:hypothetical protein